MELVGLRLPRSHADAQNHEVGRDLQPPAKQIVEATHTLGPLLAHHFHFLAGWDAHEEHAHAAGLAIHFLGPG